MINPAIEGALSAGANLAGAVDQLVNKRNSSGGMMSNVEYQLFKDNNNALDITDIKNDIDIINQELSRQIHFRGYYLLNTDIQNLPDSANGDFAFSAESGTVRMYDQNWYNSGNIVPDQVTPAIDATPLSGGTATAGISTEYSHGDHVHPLNVTTTIPPQDSASRSVGANNYYARNDHSHPLNLSTSIHPQDSASGSVDTTNFYARNYYSHPINVETKTSNISIGNGVDTNEASAYYTRHDHIHPQQLTFDGNVTATKIIKTEELTTEETDGTLNIVRTADQNIANRGLTISVDGNTLTFNGSIIAGTGSNNGATNGPVNYYAGNPLLWGVNSTGTEGGFYSNATNICWRARPITLGSVPP
ncbi:MAG: hypothetical protein EZS28_022504 [Streblomastix strix]|uniref:Uncharacterized protein n=1 Tax=Streblomastix strix TaxID=222440 RepID=A0A5J4VHE9_9EUKA|nr:MAG: hypothetical protein EZS28_022504 [Streblomastix strix]